MVFSLVLVVFLSVLHGCSGQENFERKDISIESRAGIVVINTEIARSEEQKRQGLMHRTELKDGEGMIFIYEWDQILSFWMMNTLIPLSIAFISHEGRILEISDMEPGDLNPVRSSRSARYALEVPQGWFERAGIEIGDKIDVSGL